MPVIRNAIFPGGRHVAPRITNGDRPLLTEMNAFAADFGLKQTQVEQVADYSGLFKALLAGREMRPATVERIRVALADYRKAHAGE